MACLASLLDFSFIGSTQPSGGQELLFPTFAAVIIGGASLSGGRGSVIGTLAGALLLAVLANGLALLSAGAVRAADAAGHGDHRRRGARPVHPAPAHGDIGLTLEAGERRGRASGSGGCASATATPSRSTAWT